MVREVELRQPARSSYRTSRFYDGEAGYCKVLLRRKNLRHNNSSFILQNMKCRTGVT